MLCFTSYCIFSLYPKFFWTGILCSVYFIAIEARLQQWYYIKKLTNFSQAFFNDLVSQTHFCLTLQGLWILKSICLQNSMLYADKNNGPDSQLKSASWNSVWNKTLNLCYIYSLWVKAVLMHSITCHFWWWLWIHRVNELLSKQHRWNFSCEVAWSTCLNFPGARVHKNLVLCMSCLENLRSLMPSLHSCLSAVGQFFVIRIFPFS